MILGDILRRNARNHGARPAVIFEGRTTSHAEMLDVSLRLAEGLRRLGMKKQDRIAILGQNSVEYLQVYGACEEAGFVAVGLNYRLSDPELISILNDAEPSVLFLDAQYEERAARILQALSFPVVRIVIGGDPQAEQAFERLVRQSSAVSDAPRASESDTVFIFYTSGTTGRPKGAMLGNGGQAVQYEILGKAVEAKPTDRMLIVMPLFHCGGTILQWMYKVAGATIVLHRSFDAAAILRSFRQDRVTAAHLAPVMIHRIVELLDQDVERFPDLHTIHYASAPMSVALLRRAIHHFGGIFSQSYGMTENGAGSFLSKAQHILDGTEEQVARLACAGKPFPGTQIRIVGDDGSECRPLEVGEVLTRAPGIMSGYWKNADESRRALQDGWMCTGDLGYLDGEGFLFIVDRKKDMIISGGENIYSREVEEALATHPAVSEAAVIGIPDEEWGEAVKAFVVVREGCEVDEADLADHANALLARYKRPRHFKFVADLPRLSSTSKVDKKTLRAPYWNRQPRGVA